MSISVDKLGLSIYTDGMESKDESDNDTKTSRRQIDPHVGLRAVNALHRLAERYEFYFVHVARDRGWTWEQIGDALGVSRQSVHTKYGSGGM